MVELIRALLDRAQAQGSRSTALAPVGWLVAILAALTLSSFVATDDASFQTVAIWLLAVSVAVYVVGYFVLLFRSPDSLRSERFVIQKTLLERAIVGDNLVGRIRAEDVLALPGEKAGEDLE